MIVSILFYMNRKIRLDLLFTNILSDGVAVVYAPKIGIYICEAL